MTRLNFKASVRHLQTPVSPSILTGQGTLEKSSMAVGSQGRAAWLWVPRRRVAWLCIPREGQHDCGFPGGGRHGCDSPGKGGPLRTSYCMIQNEYHEVSNFLRGQVDRNWF